MVSLSAKTQSLDANSAFKSFKMILKTINNNDFQIPTFIKAINEVLKNKKSISNRKLAKIVDGLLKIIYLVKKSMIKSIVVYEYNRIGIYYPINIE